MPSKTSEPIFRLNLSAFIGLTAALMLPVCLAGSDFRSYPPFVLMGLALYWYVPPIIALGLRWSVVAYVILLVWILGMLPGIYVYYVYWNQ